MTETIAKCEGCGGPVFEIECYDHVQVRLGDGSIDDDFYICEACVEAAREEERRSPR